MIKMKISDQGNSRSVHQVTSSGLISEKVWMLGIATPTEWSPCKFQQLVWASVYSKHSSTSEQSKLHTLNQKLATIHPSLCPRGQSQSSWKVPSNISKITFDRDTLERWIHLRCLRACESAYPRARCSDSYLWSPLTLKEAHSHAICWSQSNQMTLWDQQRHILSTIMVP